MDDEIGVDEEIVTEAAASVVESASRRKPGSSRRDALAEETVTADASENTGREEETRRALSSAASEAKLSQEFIERLNKEWMSFRERKRREDKRDELGEVPEVDALFAQEAKGFIDALAGPSKNRRDVLACVSYAGAFSLVKEKTLLAAELKRREAAAAKER